MFLSHIMTKAKEKKKGITQRKKKHRESGVNIRK